VRFLFGDTKGMSPCESISSGSRRRWRIYGRLWIYWLAAMTLVALLGAELEAVFGYGTNLSALGLASLLSIWLWSWCAWIVASRKAGLDTPWKRLRRKIWYRLAGLGFTILVAISGLWSFLAASHPVGFDGDCTPENIRYHAGAAGVLLSRTVLIVCGLSWSGWIWISWIMAGKRAARVTPPAAAKACVQRMKISNRI